MKLVLIMTVGGALLGAFFGAPTGVVGYGGGSGGMFVFGLVGGVVGCLGALALKNR